MVEWPKAPPGQHLSLLPRIKGEINVMRDVEDTASETV